MAFDPGLTKHEDPSKRWVRMKVMYVGAAYCGWQIQSEVPSVEREVTDALETISQRRTKVWGASRTDSGVHSHGQVVAFTCYSDRSLFQVMAGINALTPSDIAVRDLEEVAPAFHPRHCARGKIYRYSIVNAPMHDPFRENRAWHVRAALDLTAMQAAAARLVGEHDFESFRSAGCDAKTAIRTMYAVDVSRNGHLVEVRVHGTAFHKHMVRTLVGTLVDVGRGKYPPEWIDEVIAARSRAAAGQRAPSDGLCLEHIFYPDFPWTSERPYTISP